jgi:aerobic carbon-monoxide dehydrogenase medium subunit
MSPVQFDYAAPTSLEEAVNLLKQNAGANVLAGGLSLVNQVKLRRISPSILVDLRNIQGLVGIRPETNGVLQIGALTTCTDIAADQEVTERYHALAEAALNSGDPQVRNRGTIGGNLAHNESATDLPAVVLALEATISVVGPNGTRAIAADDFFTGSLETALSPGEIITSVDFPAEVANSGSAYEKFRNTASGHAICGVAALVGRGPDGTVNKCRVAVTGVADHAVRLRRVEAQLTSKTPNAENITNAVSQVANEGLSFLSDFYASGEYRTHLTQVLTERALTRATARRG